MKWESNHVRAYGPWDSDLAATNRRHWLRDWLRGHWGYVVAGGVGLMVGAVLP